MAYRVAAKQEVGQQFYTVTGLVQLMGGSNPPATLAFGELGKPQNTHNLGEGEGMPVQQSPIDEVTRCTGLTSCAAVCYLNADNGLAYIYHANTGTIHYDAFQAAMVAIGSGGPAHKTVYITYAHPKASDAGYQATIADLERWRVPANNIVEITHLFFPQFGMNNLLQIGY
jgi:hypothetical protein